MFWDSWDSLGFPHDILMTHEHLRSNFSPNRQKAWISLILSWTLLISYVINVVVPSESKLTVATAIKPELLFKCKQLVMALMGEHCLAFG